MSVAVTLSGLGSSPLTRGKHGRQAGRHEAHRLIPAHAGKTCRRPCRRRATTAHPRSRGENGTRRLVGSDLRGSSPLTRGKLDPVACLGEERRLIPAHAGKTPARAVPQPGAAAHPRSRGENYSTCPFRRAVPGSSPLTRGKHWQRFRSYARGRLIPAHAGKTRAATTAMARRTAHPRSRGENQLCTSSSGLPVGSSPLTRGKPLRREPDLRLARLIPAHAGKTEHRPSSFWRTAAHPRSRGENFLACRTISRAAGSSPLTRGKRMGGPGTYRG